MIGWNLCHSIGAVPHNFAEIDADFAVWCNYKYFSGGPGCTAGLYINQKHFNVMRACEAGLETALKPSSACRTLSTRRWTLTRGRRGRLAFWPLRRLKNTLRMYNEAGIKKIREKSLKLTAFLMYLIDVKLSKYGFSYINPTEDTKRGGHVALVHKDAYRICFALKKTK